MWVECNRYVLGVIDMELLITLGEHIIAVCGFATLDQCLDCGMS